MQVGYTLKQFRGMFFDRALVEGKIDRASYAVMTKFGAFVRQSGRRNFRSGSAKFPQPPNPRNAPAAIQSRKKAQGGAGGGAGGKIEGKLKRFIWFGWEPFQRTLVVGPALLPSTKDKENPPPKRVERGGTYRITRRFKSGKIRTYNANYREFPFMRNALKKELPNLPALWRDTIR